MPFELTTTAFQKNGFIPIRFTCDGTDASPALSWNEPPEGTQNFALIADDPDAPAGTWVHWVIYDMPASLRGLPEGLTKARELPDGSRQGLNDFRKIGYNGPCPPRGSAHRYFFKLYALDIKTNLVAGATKGDLERSMKGHILARSEIVGRFQH